MTMAICMLSCSTVLAQQPSQFNALISDEAAIEQIQSLEWQAAGENLDPGQTVVAGVGSRHTSSYTLSASWEPDGEANLNWDLEIHYPFPSQWQYSETFNVSGDGKIEGADGFRPSPNNVIAPARTAARSKFLWMTFPALLLRQAQNFTPVNGKPGTYRFSALDTSWQVSIDATTGLPTTLATTENDPIFGLVQTSVSYLSWQETAGIIIPTRLEFRVDGDIIRRERIESVDLVTGTPKGQPDYTLARSEPMYERGWNMAHWFTRRISLGGPMDNDLTYPVEIQEIGNGVYQVRGSSHHNLVIELDAGLVVVDAPLYPSRQEAVLETLAERWPDKPVRHLILSHHHYDHSGGLATYSAAGVPITMHDLNRGLFLDAFTRQGILTPDIRGVGDVAHLDIGGRPINLYRIPTVHAEGLLAVYIPDEKMIFIVDIYSPGQQSRNPLWAAEALSAVRFLNVPVERLVGAHGQGVQTVEEVSSALEE